MLALEQSLGLGRRAGGDDDQARDRGRKTDSIRWLCVAPSWWAMPLPPRKVIGIFELPAAHVADVGGVVHELVHADQREAPAHELDDRPQPDHRRADAKPGKAGLADRRVDDPPRAEPSSIPSETL